MSSELEARLRNHARSFDGLLSLIPAKLYYGEDVSDQWQRKKQTPEQRHAAKIAKLDPDNWKSAKDVLDERAAAAKRKRDDSDDMEQDHHIPEPEQPKVVQDLESHKTKKRKTNVTTEPAQPLSAEEKKQKKIEKQNAKKEKLQKTKDKQTKQRNRKQAEKLRKLQEAEAQDDSNKIVLVDPIATKDATTGTDDVDQWSTASSSDGAPDILSPTAESGSSSISSIPPSITDLSTLPKPSLGSQKSPPMAITLKPSISTGTAQSKTDRDAAKARLANAISSFRSARKADDVNANKPRNRTELLEQRRRKEEVKRLAKKEQKRKEREEAARIEDEEIAKRFSPGGSGSLLASPRSPPSKDEDTSVANNFSYGRIEFSDGSKINPINSTSLLDQHKSKGPQDTQTALSAAKKKAGRLAGLDEAKRKSIEEKDMWLNAKRRAHGERVRDDTSLLKKALKRQEGQKRKSEKEWGDRKDGIVKAQEARQKKRNDNLAKRKEEKAGRKAGVNKGKKIKKRPGFEGSFRGRTGGGKKKS